MSAEWPLRSLKDVADLLTGFPFKSKDYSNDENGYKLLRGDNIVQGCFRWEDVKRWPKSLLIDKDVKYFLKEGDVILAMDRPWIEAGLKFAQISSIDMPCLLVQRVACLRANETLDQDFLRYLISSYSFVEYVKQVQTGTAVPHISGKQILDFEFNLPPKIVQKSTSKILKSLDNKIQLNNQINQTLEQMAQAIFKSWFVDFEPVKAKIAALEAGGSEDDALLAAMQAIAGSALFATDAADADAQTQLARLQADHPEQYATLRATAELFPSAMQESELGEIPEGWEETGFSDWVAIKRGRSITRAKVVPGDVPVVAGGLEPAYYHNEYNVIGPVITISASGANAGYVNLYHQNIWSSDSSHISKKSTPYFYTAYVCLKYYQKAIFDMQTGAAQPHIYPKDFERLKVVVGSDKLLEQVESLLVSFFEQSAVLKSESESLAQLRDTLLPKLLSGELSLAATEEQLADTVEPAHV